MVREIGEHYYRESHFRFQVECSELARFRAADQFNLGFLPVHFVSKVEIVVDCRKYKFWPITLVPPRTMLFSTNIKNSYAQSANVVTGAVKKTKKIFSWSWSTCLVLDQALASPSGWCDPTSKSRLPILKTRNGCVTV